MFSFTLTLMTGFVLGLFYSRGKPNPLRTAKEDLLRIWRRLRNWVASIFTPSLGGEKIREQSNFPRL